MADIKDLFEERMRSGEEVYRPPIKVELVRGERIWSVSFDFDLENEDKLMKLRRFELTTDKILFDEGLDLLLKLNGRTYQAKVNAGLGHKGMPADKVKKFCEKYRAMQKGFPEDITVVTPEDASLYLRAHNQLCQNRYAFVDKITGNVEEVRRHISEADFLITAYAFLKKVEPKP